MTKFGDPGFGVEGDNSPPPAPEEPKRKSPTWDRYGHPDKYKKLSKKGRPTETDTTPPKRGKK